MNHRFVALVIECLAPQTKAIRMQRIKRILRIAPWMLISSCAEADLSSLLTSHPDGPMRHRAPVVRHVLRNAIGMKQVCEHCYSVEDSRSRAREVAARVDGVDFASPHRG